jgi:hypothetical protein
MIRHLFAGGFSRLVNRGSTSKAAGVTRRHGPNGGLRCANPPLRSEPWAKETLTVGSESLRGPARCRFDRQII